MKLRTNIPAKSDVAPLQWSCELKFQPSSHRDSTGTNLWTGCLSEVVVTDCAVHAEVRPVEQVEDVRTIDKPYATVSLQVDAFHD